MPKVSKRNGFSDRNEIKVENKEMQIKQFDERTRIQLSNFISKLYAWVYDNDLVYRRNYIQDYLKYVIGTIYSMPIDVRETYDDDEVIEMINATILSDDYDDVLTLIEAIIQYWNSYLIKTKGHEYYDKYAKVYRGTSVFEFANSFFKREYIGYRFVDEIIVPISDEYELGAVREALSNRKSAVVEHVSKANSLLSDRKNPDYENSIKESISAVEAMCELLTGTAGKEATLGKLLITLEEKGVEIHKGLKSAFNVLYGYTCDANGIRHAGNIGGPASTFEEAKFMLVSCSAFINYLTAISAD